MPASSSALSSMRPAGPTNGCPSRSSRSPGCSPTSMTSLLASPSPNTACVAPLYSSHAVQCPTSPRSSSNRLMPLALPRTPRGGQARFGTGHRDAELHQLDHVAVRIGDERAAHAVAAGDDLAARLHTRGAGAREGGVEVVDHEREVVAVADRDLRRIETRVHMLRAALLGLADQVDLVVLSDLQPRPGRVERRRARDALQPERVDV